MKLFLLFVFAYICSESVFASTLSEMEAAGAIASTLQGTAQSQPTHLVQRARDTVQRHEETQDRRIANIEAVGIGSEAHSPQTKPEDSSSSSSPLEDRSGKEASSSEGSNQLQAEKIHQKIESVDYNRDLQVFYKKECEPSQKECLRGAVLTNIKSLIFDYAHRRGSFSKIEK